MRPNEAGPEKELKMELTHAEWPGYKTAFHVVIAAGVLYLGYVFIKGFF